MTTPGPFKRRNFQLTDKNQMQFCEMCTDVSAIEGLLETILIAYYLGQ